MKRSRLSLLALVLLCACIVPDEAPPALEDVSRQLFRDFEDAEVLPDALEDLAGLLDEVDFGAGVEGRSFLLDPLTTADVGDQLTGDRLPEDCHALGLAFASEWEPADHASYLVLDDLTVLSTASAYERTVLEPDEPSCFAEADCDLLRTENAIVRDTPLFSLAYVQRKDYRWVSLEDGRALLARGWLVESAHDESGNNHMWQSFEAEVWLPRDGGSTRYYAQFSEVEYAGVSDELARSFALTGAQSAMDGAENYLASSEREQSSPAP